MHRIELRDIEVRYRDVLALDRLSLTVEPGEFLALLGPSGCGKTTLLRVIAGFVPYRGSVLFDGRSVDDRPAHRRNIGIVFQDYALFPHKTVRENIGFGLKMRKTPRAALASRVEEMLALLQLDGLAERYPGQISGGQQQRVALARAIAINPSLLLLDEPLGALDKKLREEMQVELRQLQRRIGITTIFVTHDQEEALSLADRIAIMQHGAIRQIGAGADLYERPSSLFVARFMGQSNILAATAERLDADRLHCRIPSGETFLLPDHGKAPTGDILLSFRPERLRLGAEPSSETARLTGTIEHAAYLGGQILVRVRLGDGTIFKVAAANQGGMPEIAVGAPVALGFDPADVIVLTDEPQPGEGRLR
ncbi:MAG: ABC transporter ATP-binding protein [Alphaproteobacteria bacterium]|nr:ABC transporter ATP-binding protein [Alphaproteobacteria bacterium]